MKYASVTGGGIRIFLIAIFFPGQVLAQTSVSEPQWHAYLATLAALNHGIGNEGAESLGLYGNRLGVAYRQAQVPHAAQVLAAESIYREGTSQSVLAVPSVYVSKGLPGGVNLGLDYGVLANGRVSFFGAETSVTLYEAPRLPAVAMRGAFAKVSGLQGSSLSSWELGPTVSWAFLSYVTVYAAYGWQQSQGILKANRLEDASLSLWQNGSEEDVIRHGWRQTFYQAGLRVIALPPFLTLSAQIQKSSDLPAPMIMLKLGFST